MTIVFGLAVDYGGDAAAAQEAMAAVSAYRSVSADPYRVAMYMAFVRTGPAGRTELSVVPAGVGPGVTLSGPRARSVLTAAQLTEVGAGLYDLLRTLRGHRSAAVGWDAGAVADTGRLRAARAADPRGWAPGGLVLADAVLADLGGDDRFVPFADGFSWLPWEGVRPSPLTADPVG